MHYTAQHFSNQTVTLDGNQFDDCRFTKFCRRNENGVELTSFQTHQQFSVQICRNCRRYLRPRRRT